MEIFQHRHFSKWASPFGTVNETPLDDVMGRDLVDSLPIKAHPPLNGDVFSGRPPCELPFPGHETGNGPQQRGFACAVWPHKTDQFPCINPHTQVVDQQGPIIANP